MISPFQFRGCEFPPFSSVEFLPLLAVVPSELLPPMNFFLGTWRTLLFERRYIPLFFAILSQNSNWSMGWIFPDFIRTGRYHLRYGTIFSSDATSRVKTVSVFRNSFSIDLNFDLSSTSCSSTSDRIFLDFNFAYRQRFVC